jgi:predicted aspartyl protease
MFRFALFLLVLISTLSARSEEIPLESCDRLPVIHVSISGMKFLFLVDTGATSILNLKSFVHGDARRVTVTSWTGTMATNGREIMVADLAVGRHHFKNIRLPAIDLSAIGQGCGRQIDGILGVDLLAKMGAQVDLKEKTPKLVTDTESLQPRIEELESQLRSCGEAFNRADEKSFAECMDPQIVIYTSHGDLYGRENVMQYFRSHYFQHSPPAQLSFNLRAQHPAGEAIWLEYDLKITAGEQTMVARGTALCQKQNGRWRFVNMNHS